MSYYATDGYNGFDQTYFEGREVGVDDRHPAGYWYYPDVNLDHAQYADEIDSYVGSRKLLVVGCAYGFSIRYLRDEHGWNRVYGMDISQWAVDNAFGDVADHIYQGDALNPDDYDDLARDTQGPPRWDGIYTEYLLSHFTDAAALQVLEIMADEADLCVHRIWSGTGAPNGDYFNAKSVAEWQALVDDPDGPHEWIDYDSPEESTI